MSRNATDRQSPGTLARKGGARHVTRQTLSLPGTAVDLLAMKEEARSFEEGGRFADAFALYRVILAHLEEKAVSPQVLPFYLKVGELAQHLGDTRTALTTFARGAERFASQGDASSVADLCVRIVQADASRKDAHARFARRLLVHGHVEPARQLLLDYARRARSDSLFRLLTRMDRWPEDEVRRLLTDFLDRVVPEDWKRLRTTDPRETVRAEAPRSVPTAATPMPSPPPLPSQPDHVREGRSEEPPRPPAETKPPPPVVTASTAAAPAAPSAPDVSPAQDVTGSQSAPPDATPSPAPVAPDQPQPVAEPPPLASRPHPVTTPPPVRRRRQPPPQRRKAPLPRRRRHRGILLTVTAVIVLTVSGAVGYALAPRGALPFGIKGATADTTHQNAGPQTVPAVPAATVDSVSAAPATELTAALDPAEPPAETVAHADSTQRVPATATPPALPAQRQPESPTNTRSVEPDRPIVTARTVAPDAVSDPDSLSTPPDPVGTGEEVWSLLPTGSRSPDRVVIVEGLPVLALEPFDAAAGLGIRLTQQLAGGDTVSLTVVPLDPATAGHVAVGRVLVQERGNSAVGTTRFSRYLVTGRARLSAVEMESLLRRLVELVR